MKRTFSKVLAVVFATTVTAVILIILTTIYFSFKGYLEANSRHNIVLASKLTNEEVRTWIKGKESILDNIDFMISEDLKNTKKIQRLLSQITKNDREIIDIYFADITSRSTGGRFIDGTNWTPPAAWDWHTRPWWQAAIKTDEIIYTEPYLDAITQKIVMTIAKRVKDNGKIIGVAGVDIFITKINEIVSSKKVSENSKTFLVNRDGLFITNDSHEKILKDKIYSIPELKELQTKGESDFDIDNVHGIFYSQKNAGLNGWKFVSYGPLSDVFHQLYSFIFILLVVGVAGIIGSVIISILLTRGVGKNLKVFKKSFLKLTEGSLGTINEKPKTVEFHEIQGAYNDFIDNMTQIISTIKDMSQNLSTSSEEMSSAISSMSDNTQSQSATVEEITATIEELSANGESIASNADNQASDLDKLNHMMVGFNESISRMSHVVTEGMVLTDSISAIAKEGDANIRFMNDSIGNISKSSAEMTGIINIINDISEQINLLSLNAAIEAARAGESGRGFAVVADEISKLAEETASSINDINRLIKQNEAEIQKGMSNAHETVESLRGIIEGVTSINMKMSTINSEMNVRLEENGIVISQVGTVKVESENIKNSTHQQQIALSEMVNSVSLINELSQSSASGAEQMSANSQILREMAEQLNERIGFFKISEKKS